MSENEKANKGIESMVINLANRTWYQCGGIFNFESGFTHCSKNIAHFETNILMEVDAPHLERYSGIFIAKVISLIDLAQTFTLCNTFQVFSK